MSKRHKASVILDLSYSNGNSLGEIFLTSVSSRLSAIEAIIDRTEQHVSLGIKSPVARVHLTTLQFLR